MFVAVLNSLRLVYESPIVTDVKSIDKCQG